jgi:hypothetical protein
MSVRGAEMGVPKPAAAENFDPYHKWLGIAPKDQPPSYYRLLGIDLFESDPDVIASATDQRMAHVRSFQTGKNAAISQRILNELAAAKVCLLDAGKKARYDAGLRRPQPAAVLPPPVAGNDSAAPAVMPGIAGESFDLEFPTVKSSRKKKSSGPDAAVWVLGLVTVAAAAAVLTWMFVLNPREDKRRIAKSESARPQKETETKGATNSEPHAEPRPEPKDKPRDEPKVELPVKPEPEPTPPAKPKPAAAQEPQPRPLPPEPDLGPQPDTRRDPPDEHLLKTALATIRQVYKQDYKTADTAALAKKLLGKGDQTRNDAVARFALYREARDLALSARDGPIVFQAIDAMAADYKVNAPEMKETMLESASKGVQLPAQHEAIASAAIGVIDAAVADESFPLARRLGRLALAQARLAKDTSLVQQVVAKNKECEAAAKTFAEAQNALAALETTPEDPSAKTIAGKYLCFQKGDWKRGLPMLAAGSDEALKALAEQDLKRPTAADDQVKLGDDWWQQADNAGRIAKSNIQKRAAYWYDLGSTGAAGLVKDKAESRVKEALTVVTPLGVVQPGNLALASNGATVSGVARGAEYLLDGSVTNYSDRIHGLASSPCPCEWTIHLHGTYLLKQIRFLLFDLDPVRFYRYKVEVSADGQAFTPLVDHSRGEWRGWQEFSLPSQPVSAVKIIGLYCSAAKEADKAFQVVELEAYSILPRR